MTKWEDSEPIKETRNERKIGGKKKKNIMSCKPREKHLGEEVVVKFIDYCREVKEEIRKETLLSNQDVVDDIGNNSIQEMI